MDDQMWNELSEEWQQYLREKKKAQPCDPTCIQQYEYFIPANPRVKLWKYTGGLAAQSARSCDENTREQPPTAW